MDQAWRESNYTVCPGTGTEQHIQAERNTKRKRLGWVVARLGHTQDYLTVRTSALFSFLGFDSLIDL